MHFRIIQPNGFLKNYIKQYCFMESEVHEGDVTERVIPSGGVQLMFHYRNPFVVSQPGNKLAQQPRSILSGLSHSFSDVSTHGEAGVVFIQFYPVGACHFFNFPLSHIENQSVNLKDVFQSETSPVEERLYLEKSLIGKVKIIENFLLKRFSPILESDYQMLLTGIRLIKQTKGQIPASTLSGRMCVTSKSLERKFAAYLGKTPKQFIRLIRYQEILANFSKYKNIHLTEHAYLNGYFDQSHFIKDFKTFTGYTPKEFVARYPDYDLNADTC
jgi:AraC-like DNA-binding protein